MKNKKGMMLGMSMPYLLGGLVIGIIIGMVLMAYLINHGMFSASAIPV